MRKNSPDAHCFPRRLVMLLASSAIGGEERYFMELAIAMQKRGTEPIIIDLKTSVPYRSELEKAEVRFYEGVAPRQIDILGVFRFLRMIRRLHPDALIINGNRQALWFGLIADIFCKIPVTIVHTHSHMGLYSLTLRIVSHFVDAIMAAAHEHRSYLCSTYHLKANRVVTVYPGIDQSRTSLSASAGSGRSKLKEPRTVGIIAALRPEKDHETFLKASALVSAEMSNIKFLVIGDGSRRQYLEKLSDALGLRDRVRFLGWQTVDGSLLQQLDLLVLSSMSETFPAVIIEAFSAALPIVATDVGSVSELFGSTLSGLLVQPRDPKALAEAMLRILKDLPLMNQMAESALMRANFFSAERFYVDTLRLARKIATAKGVRCE